MADDKITEREDELLHLIGKQFKFDDETVDAIKQFVVNQDPYDYSTSYSVIVSGAEEPDRSQVHSSRRIARTHCLLQAPKGGHLFLQMLWW